MHCVWNLHRQNQCKTWYSFYGFVFFAVGAYSISIVLLPKDPPGLPICCVHKQTNLMSGISQTQLWEVTTTPNWTSYNHCRLKKHWSNCIIIWKVYSLHVNFNEGMSDDSLAFFRPWKYVLIPREEAIIINFHDCVFWSESVGMVLTQQTHLTYDLPSAFNSIVQRDDIAKIGEEVQYICSKMWWRTHL